MSTKQKAYTFNTKRLKVNKEGVSARIAKASIDYMIRKDKSVYLWHYSLTAGQKRALQSALQKIIRLNLMNDSFYQMLAQTIIDDNGFITQSKLSQWALKHLFNGKTRTMLYYLQKVKAVNNDHR